MGEHGIHSLCSCALNLTLWQSYFQIIGHWRTWLSQEIREHIEELYICEWKVEHVTSVNAICKEPCWNTKTCLTNTICKVTKWLERTNDNLNYSKVNSSWVKCVNILLVHCNVKYLLFSACLGTFTYNIVNTRCHSLNVILKPNHCC